MRTLNVEINWKGIGDYLSAARTIEQYGTSNTSGPKIHCQGLALELALKFYLWNRFGAYVGTHNLEFLAFDQCKNLKFTDEEIEGIKNLNTQYLRDEDFPFPARYRPTSTRVFLSISQHVLENVISKIIQSTSQPKLVERILAR